MATRMVQLPGEPNIRSFRRAMARCACIGVAWSLSGCYGAVGPSISFVHNGPVALGFEASAATATVGSSWAVGSPGERPWRQRTFVAWEPRLGLPTAHLDSADGKGFGFAGVGGTLGAHWDTTDDAAALVKARFLGGAFLGGGYALPVGSSSGCSDAVHPYVSLAFGVRGDEIYLTPKVGALDVPGFCISVGSGF